MPKERAPTNLSPLEDSGIEDLKPVPEIEYKDKYDSGQKAEIVMKSLTGLGAQVVKAIAVTKANDIAVAYKNEMTNQLLELKKMSPDEQLQAYENGAISDIYERHYKETENGIGGEIQTKLRTAMNQTYQSAQISAYKGMLQASKTKLGKLSHELKAGAISFASDIDRNGDIEGYLKGVFKGLNIPTDTKQHIREAAHLARSEAYLSVGNLRMAYNPDLLKKMGVTNRTRLDTLKVARSGAHKDKWTLRLKDSKNDAQMLGAVAALKNSLDPAFQKFGNATAAFIKATADFKVKGKNPSPLAIRRYNKAKKVFYESRPYDMKSQDFDAIKATVEDRVELDPQGNTGKDLSRQPAEQRMKEGNLLPGHAADQLYRYIIAGDEEGIKSIMAQFNVPKELEAVARGQAMDRAISATGNNNTESLRAHLNKAMFTGPGRSVFPFSADVLNRALKTVKRPTAGLYNKVRAKVHSTAADEHEQVMSGAIGYGNDAERYTFLLIAAVKEKFAVDMSKMDPAKKDDFIATEVAEAYAVSAGQITEIDESHALDWFTTHIGIHFPTSFINDLDDTQKKRVYGFLDKFRIGRLKESLARFDAATQLAIQNGAYDDVHLVYNPALSRYTFQLLHKNKIKGTLDGADGKPIAFTLAQILAHRGEPDEGD